MMFTWLAATATRYGAVGAACALLNIAIVWLGTERLGWPYPVAAAATCVITIPLSYLLHRRVSFRLAGPAQWREFGRFVAAQVSQFGLGFLLMALVVESLHWRPWLAMAGVSAAMVAYGFVASLTWVFRARQRARGAAIGDAATGRRALRVLQVSAFFPAHGGGIEAVAGHLAQGLADAGVQVTWMAGGAAGERPAGAHRLEIEHAGSVDFVERRLGLPAPLWNLAALRTLWRAIGGCDLVQVHDYLYFPSLMALLFAGLRGRPVVLTQHVGDIAFESRAARGVLRALNRTLGRLVLARVARVVFVGRPVQAYFERFVRFRRPPALLSNGVDHALYRPAGDRPPRPDDAPLEALFVGRFVEKKGLPLLRACAELPGLHWTFVGRGPLSPADWGLAPALVHVAGALPPAAVADAMRAADVLVLPSKGEGFPLVVQEALACGTPVLVSQEVADAFPQRDPGCVLAVDLGDPAPPAPAQRLRDAVAALAASPARVRDARPAAVALAAQWSWARCVEGYLAIYRDL